MYSLLKQVNNCNLFHNPCENNKKKHYLIEMYLWKMTFQELNGEKKIDISKIA